MPFLFLQHYEVLYRLLHLVSNLCGGTNAKTNVHVVTDCVVRYHQQYMINHPEAYGAVFR